MIVAFPSRNPEIRAVGVRLKALRERRGMSREALALEVRVTQDRIARAELGLERLTSVELYAATMALHIPMRLLFEDGPPHWPSA